MSFRHRLLLTSLLTLAVGLGAVLAIGNVLLEHRVDSEATGLLRGRAEAQVAALTVTRAGVLVRDTANDTLLDRRSWVLDGARVVERPAGAPSALDRAAVALGRARRRVERAGPGRTRLLALPLTAPGAARPTGAVVVAMSVRPLERLESEVLAGSVIVACLVLLAGGLAIGHAVRGALRPVAQMTATAEDWGEHDLDRRFDLGPPRDELTGLAATLDHLLARIAASRRHEQRFASEIAHELRTPLAGLRGRAELALGARGAGAEREAALRTVVERADALNRTIDALLALARQQLDPAAGAVDLAQVAREFEDVEVVAPSGLPRAEGEQLVVHRALAPLVDNARRHARSRVAIELSADDSHVRAAVRDDGPGLEPGLGERVFDPGVRGNGDSQGASGLGLALARRLARSCGGDVVVGGGPGGCFVLVLPAVAGP